MVYGYCLAIFDLILCVLFAHCSKLDCFKEPNFFNTSISLISTFIDCLIFIKPGKVCDAVEVAGKNVMSTSSTVTTELVTHK